MPASASELQTVTDRLPFSVDDTGAANDAFRQWKEEEDPDAKRLADLWTYCYVCRYFLAKSARGTFDNPSDADELTTRAYRKVQKNRDGVRNAGRYANWVSVVCKNTLLNYTRRNQFSESIDDTDRAVLTAGTTNTVAEVGFVHEAFVEAIERLPAYLQEPARLYFLEDREFEEISEAVGKPVATVRTYKHKAMKQLRTDDRLREYANRGGL
ncbi:RNA polymerase sigma factor [Salinibacter altiplanensis]|uniref:RNA polymerase sigma factor n=1 Tax=Salinibacter altiplanensis TaxID=1803181 RepID=UPI000C9F89F0|nr:sigma-70 family RNA polymerase sigma factor [Salinibacter altiplanensis]